jgi:hypothetical protein
MADLSQVKEHMTVIGADGVRVGTVDKVEGDRIKLTKDSSPAGPHSGHHHYLPGGLVAAVEGDSVRLSSNGNVALLFEEEQAGSQVVNTASLGSGQTQVNTVSPAPARPQFEASEEKPVWNWNKLGIGAATLGPRRRRCCRLSQPQAQGG